jgi:hypothetical protein
MNNPVSQWTEQEEKEYIIDLLRRRNMLDQKDNVIHSEKAFVINSILKLCFKKSKKNRQSKEEWLRYLKIIDSYIRDKTDIKWRSGKFEIYEK